MPIKFDISTNISENELTSEKCHEIINALQISLDNIRGDMYILFLGKKNLMISAGIASIVFFLFMITQDYLFLYLTPVSILLSLLVAIISAEYLVLQSKKFIKTQIDIYKHKLEVLKLKEEKAI